MQLKGLGAIIPNVNWQKCRDMKGTQVNCRSSGTYYAGTTVSTAEKICDCYVPDAPVTAAAPQPSQITVSPAITVSPQISPIFQQQFQPTNSPATAGTQQTAAPMVETVPSYAPAPAPVAAPAPAPAPYVPPVAPSGAIDYSGAVGPGPDIAYPPDLATALQTSVGAPVPAPVSAPEKSNTLLFAALGVLGILLLSKKQGKAKHATR